MNIVGRDGDSIQNKQKQRDQTYPSLSLSNKHSELRWLTVICIGSARTSTVGGPHAKAKTPRITESKVDCDAVSLTILQRRKRCRRGICIL